MTQNATPLYYEDVDVGMTFRGEKRQITRHDIDAFAVLCGDRHPIHVDDDFAAQSEFGQRILHGPFGIAFALGMFSELAEFRATAIALLDVREWSFKKPVFVGDTLHADVEIVAKRLSKSGRGIVDRRFTIIKKGQEIAQEGNAAMLICTRQGSR